LGHTSIARLQNDTPQYDVIRLKGEYEADRYGAEQIGYHEMRLTLRYVMAKNHSLGVKLDISQIRKRIARLLEYEREIKQCQDANDTLVIKS